MCFKKYIDIDFYGGQKIKYLLEIPASFGLKIEVNFLRHFTILLLKLFWIWIFRQLKFAIECFYNYLNNLLLECMNKFRFIRVSNE